MATTNEELKKGNDLIKDQITEVGFLDNAFKTLGATITAAIEDSIDAMSGMDDISKKIAKSYERDIVGSIRKSTQGLEDQVKLQVQISNGVNVQQSITKKLEENEARRLLVLEKIGSLEGVAPEDKKRLEEKAIDVFEAEKKSLKTLEARNVATQKAKSFTQILKENVGGLADNLDKSGTLSKILSGNFLGALTPTRLLEIALLGIGKAMISVDKQTGELAKGLNISYQEALELRGELNQAANATGELSISAAGLGEALMAVNTELGITNKTIDENLIFFQKIHKTAGLTYEQLQGVNAITNATGGNLKANTGEILAQAKIQGTKLGVALNEKEVLKDISKVSAATTVSLGMSASEIGKAVSVAKSLGMELGKVDNIAGSLLDFEDSITKELEAELLLGKNLNLEKARTAALNNDLATVAEEIAKQAGTAAEFGAMNRIEQEALAAAVGMGRDELGQMLFTQEQLVGLSGDEVALREKQINDLQAKGLSQDQIKAKLSKQSIEDLKAQNSIQENLAKATEKLSDAFAGIAVPIMNMITPLIELLIPAISTLQFLLTPVYDMFEGMSGILSGSLETLDGWAIAMGVFGIGATVAFGIVKSIAIYKGISAGYDALMLSLQAGQKLGILGTIGALTVQLGIQLGLLSASLATNAAVTFGVGVAIAVAAAMAGYAAIKAMTADDLMSPGGSGGGYGKRTLMGPEGAIALNNKDTVIAGTNLFPKGDDVLSAPAGEIQMPAPVDNSRMEGLLESLVRDQRARPVIANPGVIQIQ